MVGLLKLLRHAASKTRQVCYYIGPSERQAREMGWGSLKQIIPLAIVNRIRESDLEVELTNGSTIKVHGPSSLRGTRLDLAVLDECAFMPADLWPAVIRPMLADSEGGALLSSTPNGRNYFYDLYEAAQSQPGWQVFHFRSDQGGRISDDELCLLRSSMDAKHYAREIEASFEACQGRVYHAFSREVNVTDLDLVPDLPLLIGLDFNISPMTAVIAQKIGDQCHVSAEVVINDSNTFEMMAELRRRYPSRQGVVHPDPSGAARKTSAPLGQTDSLGQEGGRRKNRSKLLEAVSVSAMTAVALRDVLARAIVDVQTKRMTPRVASALAQLCNSSHRIRQTADLEIRVARLEDELGRKISNPSQPPAADANSETSGAEPGPAQEVVED